MPVISSITHLIKELFRRLGLRASIHDFQSESHSVLALLRARTRDQAACLFIGTSDVIVVIPLPRRALEQLTDVVTPPEIHQWRRAAASCTGKREASDAASQRQARF